MTEPTRPGAPEKPTSLAPDGGPDGNLASQDNPAFDTLKLRPELLTAIGRLGYKALTDIQARGLPLTLGGRDLVGHARTGSGKTVAFGLTLLQRLKLATRAPQALVLSPTRELAEQLTSVLRGLAVALEGTRIITLTGGSPGRDQRASLAAGAHVIVGTPGRVLQHVTEGRLVLDGVSCLVLDEADRMLDMGFEDEVREIIQKVPRKRQTLLFSATWPTAMAELSQQIQNNPELVSTGGQVSDELLRQTAVLCDPAQRDAALLAQLATRPPTPTLIFCEMKRDCARVAKLLRGHRVSALALHGDLEQPERDDVLAQLRNASARVLVATNVAARGLDLAGLGLVICYELSREPGVHLHRVGRTARAAAEGEAVSLVAGPDEKRRLETLERETGTRLTRVTWSHREIAPLAAWTAPNRTLMIVGGRKDKLRAGDVLGALTRDVGIDGNDVGDINLTDRRTWVALRAGVAERAAKGLDNTRIKKRRYRVHLVDRG